MIERVAPYDNRPMEIRQIECFVAVAEARSFTRAADRLFAVQSTISAAIKTLEGEIGTLLFDRSTKHVRLTPAGKAFLPAARELLLAFARAKVVASELSEGLRGELRVGTMNGLQATETPRLFSTFRDRYPHVDIQLRVSPSGSSGLAADLRANKLDVALVSLPDSRLTDLSVRELARSPMVLIVPPGHRFAPARRSERGAHVRLQDLSEEEFVDFPAGFGTRLIVDDLFQKARIRRRISCEVVDVRVIASYVEAGIGIAVVPESAIPETSTVAYVEVVDMKISWPLYAAVLKSAPPTRVVRAFLDLLEDEAGSGSWSFVRSDGSVD